MRVAIRCDTLTALNILPAILPWYNRIPNNLASSKVFWDVERGAYVEALFLSRQHLKKKGAKFLRNVVKE